MAALGAEFGDSFAANFPGFTGGRLYLNTAMAAIRTYERPLGERLIAGLREILRVTVYGITDRARFDRRLHAVGIRTVPGGRRLEQEGIFVRD
jgi:selenocysteine lyase/cysteine desulfurase